MGPIVALRGFSNFADLVAELQHGADATLADLVVDEMTTNETSFFRDVHPFEILKNTVLPTLLEEREHERKLQIWSAGCASGQEPYSIAMLLKEEFPELGDWTVSIVATDLSRAALEKAREGSYSQLEVNRGLPKPLLRKYFSQSGVRFRISAEIRDMVEFRRLNLVDSLAGMPPSDIVFLRNVLIYFELDVKRDALMRVHDLMNPNAHLFLGGAETTLNVDERFERIDGPPRSACYRLKEVSE